MEAKWKTITSAVAKWGLVPLPPSKEVLLALGAALKAGGYRSADTYLSLWKVSCERAGHALGTDLERLLKDITRSCKRGIGAPVKPLGLPLERFRELPGGLDSWTPLGPLGPRTAMIVGAWFMTREAELSSTRASLVTFGSDPKLGGDTVSWFLPASKSDSEARGTARTHGCCCTSPLTACPVHELKRHLDLLKSKFGSGTDLALPPDLKP